MDTAKSTQIVIMTRFGIKFDRSISSPTATNILRTKANKTFDVL